ncbi:MAG: YciI family protein [Devosia sp.]
MTTQNYLCIQRSQTGQSPKGEAPSPAQMEQMYAQFNTWREKFKENIIDLGGRLGSKSRIVTPDGEVDGPSVELKELIGGYMIIAAQSLDEAVAIARQCPGVIRPGASLEVREITRP